MYCSGPKTSWVSTRKHPHDMPWPGPWLWTVRHSKTQPCQAQSKSNRTETQNVEKTFTLGLLYGKFTQNNTRHATFIRIGQVLWKIWQRTFGVFLRFTVYIHETAKLTLFFIRVRLWIADDSSITKLHTRCQPNTHDNKLWQITDLYTRNKAATVALDCNERRNATAIMTPHQFSLRRRIFRHWNVFSVTPPLYFDGASWEQGTAFGR